VRDQLVEVGGVHVEPDDIREGHVGRGQDVLQVVEGEVELGGHVAGVLGVAVGVDRVLAAAHEQPLRCLDELTLVEAQVDGPGGRVDRSAGGHSRLLQVLF
jgi:hypothetical protein